MIQAEPVVRMFDILRKEGCNYVTQADLKSMMAGILLSHPGLEFLQETPEFQDRCRCAIAVSAHLQTVALCSGRIGRLRGMRSKVDGCPQVCGDCDLPHFLRLGSVRDRDALAARAQTVSCCLLTLSSTQ